MDSQDNSEHIVGRYIMYEECGLEEILQAMGYNYPSRKVIMNATKYLQIKKHGEYWEMTEYFRSSAVKESFSLKFRSGKKFSWTARNGSEVKSLITKVDKRFEFRHEPSDLQEYKTLYGEMEFFEDGDVVIKTKVEEVDGFEAVYNFKKYE